MSALPPVLYTVDNPDSATLGATPLDFLERLEGPTLVRVAGRDRSRSRALAVLLHGNEPSGFRALHAWLATRDVPAVDLHVFIGAVDAARGTVRDGGARAQGRRRDASPASEAAFAYRMLPGRRDLNRCFVPPFEDFEGRVAAAVLDYFVGVGCESLVDLHNTTGETPPYGILSVRDDVHRGLVSLFAPTAIVSDVRLGTLTEAFEGRAPAVTIECGRGFDPASDLVAAQGLERYVSCDVLPGPGEHAPVAEYGDTIRVEIASWARVAFADAPVQGAHLTFKAELDRHNFELLEEGATFGWMHSSEWPLIARDGQGRERASELFYEDGGVLRARRAMMPIMVTTRPSVALQDCLCYVVSPLSGDRATGA